jgi:hypothetical protein
MKKFSVFIAVIIISGIIGVLYLNLDKIESTINIGNPALKLTISTGVNESDGSPIITNFTFEQIRVIYKGTDAISNLPEISIMVRNESLKAAPITYWAAQPWVEGEDETHTFTLTFRDSYTPKKGDMLILQIRFTGIRGYNTEKKTAFYEWQ